jgi:hypothetical protein
MRKLKLIGAFVLSILCAAALSWGQANVNESLETASLYVDAINGSDSNPGTQQLPLKTISAAASSAVKNNWSGIGTKVIINPGTYRESISIGTSSSVTALPITFQAATTGTAVVSGADVWTGWQTYSGNPEIYTNSWTYHWGLCPLDTSSLLQQDIILRREIIAVNGTMLTQVLSLSEMLAGTFYVDETHGTVYVWPPSGTSMSTARVEVSTRSGLFSNAGFSNLVLRGLTFQYDNSCRGGAAVNIYNSASNVLVDTDNFNWNNAMGLTLQQATYVTVQNSEGNHNGQMGMNSVQTKYGLWQNDQGSYNNWRGAQGAYYGWGNGGIHFYQMHDDTITSSTAIYNQTHGFHWDTDNADITVDSLVSSENLATALLIERSEGPMSLSNSYFCNGNSPANSTVVNGISVNNSEFVSVTGSSIYNGGNQITVAGVQGGFMVTNWETGQVYDLYTQNFTLSEDTIEGVGSSQGTFYDTFGGTDWTNFQTTLVSDYNTWWDASNTTPFGIPGSPYVTDLDFAAWKSTMGTDAHSTWQAPVVDPSTACKATPDAPDFWLTASAGSLTVRPTTPAIFTATVTSLDFTGTVNLSSDGVQSIPGATASWSSSSVTNSGTSTFTVNTSSSTPAGSYPVVLIANSGGVTRTSTVSVVVDSSVGISSDSLTFPNQAVGTSSAPTNVTLSNNSSTALSITSIDITGTGQNDFAQTNTCGSSLAAGHNCTISVTFNPQISGALAASVTITDSDATSPQSVSLSGTGIAPIATVSTSSLTFASQLINTTSPAQVVTLSNTGSDTLDITAISIYGSFSQTNTCGSTLAVGKSCTVTVTFTPQATGSLSGSLTFTNNGLPSFEKVTLSGTGIAGTPTASPASLTFANQVVQTTSTAQNVTLTNTGTAALTITSISVYGNFAESATCGSTLAVGASCTISVTFTPKTSGSLTGTLTVHTNGSPASAPVTLSGTGVAPVASASPSSLTFANQVVNTTSPGQVVTLTNAGTSSLSITAISIYGSFGETNNCGLTLAAGASCTVSVTFSPKTQGALTGSLTFTNNGLPSFEKVTLSGTGIGPIATVSPASLTFADQIVDTTSAARVVTLTNAGASTMTITAISIYGAFGETSTCGSTLAAGASCTASVTFAPKITGSLSGSLTFTNDGTPSFESVALSGTGTKPAVTLSPASLNFGSQQVSTTSPAQTVTLTNTGTATLTLTSISASGNYAVPSNTCGSSLLVDKTCTISVTFTPTGKGTRTGSLSVVDNASPSTQWVSLTGSGT